MRARSWLVPALVVAAANAASTDRPAEPADYRLEDYRAPVPATVAGGKAIDTAEAEALWREHRALFVDVLPAPRRPENLPPETLWRPGPRRDIPARLRLPEVR